MTPQQLKSSILQLAIQGKLVPQIPAEGTGEELYQQIQKEKQALIKSGKIKKEKPLPPIAEDEIPFEIPEGWRWCRLSEIGITQTGNTPSKNNPEYFGNDIPFIGPGDINNNIIDYTNKGISLLGKGVARIVSPLSILQVCIGGSIGKAAINLKEVAFNQQINTISPLVCNITYLFNTIISSYFVDTMKKMAGGTATPIINRSIWNNIPIPLPPLAEQRRIVAKIEELMPLIDRYDKAWTQLEAIQKKFPGDLKKSILQMAIQGKLVPQIPTEGTGEELYLQIQKEKQALIKSGKIKKEKPLPPIAEDEIPFEIPEGWRWCRLGEIINLLSGFAFKSVDFKTEGKYRLLRGINLGVNIIRWDDSVYVDSISKQASDYKLKKNDILLGLDRPWISSGTRVAIFEDDIETYLVQRVLRIRTTFSVYNFYIYYLLHSPLLSILISDTTGISVPHISPNQVGSIVIPLPPLAEQRRIVAKIEELMPICDRLIRN